MKHAILAACLMSVSLGASAEELGRARLGYAGFVAGLNIVNLESGVSIRADGYEMGLSVRSAGTFGAFVTIRSHASAEGTWRGDHAVPQRYTSWGLFRGDERHTDIVYPDGDPLIQVLVPERDTDREPVPDALRRGTMDGFSMIADLVRGVAKSGGCDGQVHTFDGRRAAVITSHTGGVDVLPQESRSMFQGPALRCDFESLVLAGLPRDVGPDDSARRPQKGSIWLAHVLPGMPMLPVLLTMDTRLAGHVNVYLTQASSQVDLAEFTPRAP